MDTARTLEEKRERVLEQMRAIRSMRPGSVTEQYLARIPLPLTLGFAVLDKSGRPGYPTVHVSGPGARRFANCPRRTGLSPA